MDSVNVILLAKGKENWVFVYEDGREADVLRLLGRYASNPDLDFTWYDAATLSRKVRANEDLANDSGPDDISTFDAGTAVLGPQSKSDPIGQSNKRFNFPA